MRLSSMTDYAVVLLSATARTCGQPAPGGARLGGVKTAGRTSAAGLAAATGLALPTVHKLVTALSRAGLLVASRGTGGGIRLARPAAAISLAEIVEAIEGPIALTACIDDGRHDCALEGVCKVQPHWPVVNSAVRDALAGINLTSLAQ